MKRIIRPEAILVSMSRKNVIEWNGLEYLDRFFQLYYSNPKTDDDRTWWYKIGQHFPKFEPLFVYFVIHNQILWRFNFVKFHDMKDNPTTLFKGNSETLYTEGKYIVCCGPSIKAPSDIPLKGFQGFRYSSIIY